MDLWNRSVAAVTLVLAALLLGALGLSALLGRYPPKTRLASNAAAQLPHAPSVQNAPRAPASNSESLRARQRAAMLEDELEKRNELVVNLTGQVEQLQQQLALLRRQRDESLGLLSDIAATSNAEPTGLLTSSTDNTADAEAVGEEPGAVERQLELEELRSQLQEVQTLLEAAQQQADSELASATTRHATVMQAATAAFVRVGPPAVPGLIAALESPRAEVRRWAAETLEAMGPDAQSALTALTLTRDDPDDAVRTAVESALRTIPN